MRRVFGMLVVLVALAGCASGGGGGQVVKIASTENGFEPATVEVEKGKPVTLVFKRTTDRTCATEVVFENDGSKHALPLNRDVKVTLNPTEAGEIHYACGMNMLTGKIVVK